MDTSEWWNNLSTEQRGNIAKKLIMTHSLQSFSTWEWSRLEKWEQEYIERYHGVSSEMGLSGEEKRTYNREQSELLNRYFIRVFDNTDDGTGKAKGFQYKLRTDQYGRKGFFSREEAMAMLSELEEGGTQPLVDELAESLRDREKIPFEVVEDSSVACPVCGAYWGNPDPKLDFKNREKYSDKQGSWFRCYNPDCQVSYYLMGGHIWQDSEGNEHTVSVTTKPEILARGELTVDEELGFEGEDRQLEERGEGTWRIHGDGKPVIEVWEAFNGDLYFITDYQNKSTGDMFCFARLYDMPQFAEWGYNNINQLRKQYGKHKIWPVERRNWPNIFTYEEGLLVRDGD